MSLSKHVCLALLGRQTSNLKLVNLGGEGSDYVKISDYESRGIVTILGVVYAVTQKEIIKIYHNGTRRVLKTLKYELDIYAKVVSFENRIYVLRSNESTLRYDPESNNLEDKLSTCRLGIGFCCCASEETIFAMGGSGTEVSAMKYDPVTNEWTNIAPMAYGRVEAAAGTIKRRPFVVGGSDESEPECFSARDGRWAKRAETKVPRSDFAVCVVGGELIAIGGDPSWRGGKIYTHSIEVFLGYFWRELTKVEVEDSTVFACHWPDIRNHPKPLSKRRKDVKPDESEVSARNRKTERKIDKIIRMFNEALSSRDPTAKKKQESQRNVHRSLKVESTYYGKMDAEEDSSKYDDDEGDSDGCIPDSPSRTRTGEDINESIDVRYLHFGQTNIDTAGKNISKRNLSDHSLSEEEQCPLSEPDAALQGNSTTDDQVTSGSEISKISDEFGLPDNDFTDLSTSGSDKVGADSTLRPSDLGEHVEEHDDRMVSDNVTDHNDGSQTSIQPDSRITINRSVTATTIYAGQTNIRTSGDNVSINQNSSSQERGEATPESADDDLKLYKTPLPQGSDVSLDESVEAGSIFLGQANIDTKGDNVSITKSVSNRTKNEQLDMLQPRAPSADRARTCSQTAQQGNVDNSGCSDGHADNAENLPTNSDQPALQINIKKSVKADRIFQRQANIDTTGNNTCILEHSRGEGERNLVPNSVDHVVHIPEGASQSGSIIEVDQSIEANDIFQGQANIGTSGDNLSKETNSSRMTDCEEQHPDTEQPTRPRQTTNDTAKSMRNSSQYPPQENYANSGCSEKQHDNAENLPANSGQPALQISINKSVKADRIFRSQANLYTKGNNTCILENSPSQGGRKLAPFPMDDVVNIPEGGSQSGSIIVDQSVQANDIFRDQANIGTSGNNLSVKTNSSRKIDREGQHSDPEKPARPCHTTAARKMRNSSQCAHQFRGRPDSSEVYETLDDLSQNVEEESRDDYSNLRGTSRMHSSQTTLDESDTQVKATPGRSQPASVSQQHQSVHSDKDSSSKLSSHVSPNYAANSPHTATTPVHTDQSIVAGNIFCGPANIKSKQANITVVRK